MGLLPRGILILHKLKEAAGHKSGEAGAGNELSIYDLRPLKQPLKAPLFPFRLLASTASASSPWCGLSSATPIATPRPHCQT